MTFEEELKLAEEMGIENPLHFVTNAKINYYCPLDDGHEYVTFNGKLKIVSTVSSVKTGVKGWQESLGNWDEILSQPYPDKYYTNKEFRLRYKIKQMIKIVEHFEVSLAKRRPYAHCFLEEAVGDLAKLEAQLRFLKSGKSVAALDFNEIKSKANFYNLLDNYGFKIVKMSLDRYKIICPFHNDINPSIVIYQNQNRFHCYGCNKNGDIIDFVKDYEHVSTKEAVNKLSTI